MRLLRGTPAIGLLIVMLTGCAGAPPAPAPAPDPVGPVEMPPFAKHTSLRLLLAQQRYDELEAALEQFRAASLWSVEKGEYGLVHAYWAFDVSDTDVGDQIEQWIEKRPNSYQAYTARALHNISKALDARGSKFARETSEDQFRVMRRFMKEAERDTRTALKLQPRNIAAYRALIIIARYSGDRFGELTDEALRAFPESFTLQANTLISLQPKWHGTLELMERFARLSQEHAAQNPRLKIVLGYPDWARGEILRGEKRFDEAIEMYTRAMELGGEDVDFLTSRSIAARGARRYDMAIKDGKRAIELSPWLQQQEETELTRAVSSALRYASQQYLDGNHDEAIRVWSILLEHDPNDKELLAYRGESLCDSGKIDAGIADLDRALGIDPAHRSAIRGLVQCHMLGKKFVEGIKRMEATLLRAPGNHFLRIELARLYLGQKDLKSAAATYAMLCHEDYANACAQLERLLEWARSESPKLLEHLPTEKRAPHVVERIATAEEYEAYMQSLEQDPEFKEGSARAKFVARPAPMYPAWAMDTVEKGSVDAKLYVRADGSVAGVQILSAKPAGYFELAALTALLQWRFDTGGQGFIAAQNLEFKMAPQPAAGAKKKR